MAHSVRKTARLRFGRLSIPSACYFVTFCTKDRVRVLTERRTAGILVDVLNSLDESREIALIAACIMPDHVHLLFTLGSRLRVGQVLGKIKALTRRRVVAGWSWQEESFEHQVRPDDSLEDFGFYIFMNPYQANLCRLDERWPWWVCPRPASFRFLSCLECGLPVPGEWIGRAAEIGSRMVVRARKPGPSASDGLTRE
jgi:REP element-mobilizing transposase RayT